MCLLLVAKNTLHDFPLIVVANRDEHHNRRTESLTYWESGLLGGRDLEGGGTWLGISNSGKIAALTNFPSTKASPQKPISRGLIVRDFLIQNGEAEEYISSLENRDNEFLGYNLLLGRIDDLYIYSNVVSKNQVLDDGIHVMTNTFFDENWPKGRRLIDMFKAISSDDSSELITKCFNILGPKNNSLSLHYSYKNSIFITGNSYGTRSSSVILFHSNGNIEFHEKSFNKYQRVTGKKKIILKNGKVI